MYSPRLEKTHLRVSEQFFSIKNVPVSEIRSLSAERTPFVYKWDPLGTI